MHTNLFVICNLFKFLNKKNGHMILILKNEIDITLSFSVIARITYIYNFNEITFNYLHLSIVDQKTYCILFTAVVLDNMCMTDLSPGIEIKIKMSKILFYFNRITFVIKLHNTHALIDSLIIYDTVMLELIRMVRMDKEMICCLIFENCCIGHWISIQIHCYIIGVNTPY